MTEITLGRKAKHLLSSLHPEFADVLLKSIEDVHPAIRLGGIQLERPAFILAIGKNALVQAREIVRSFPDKIFGMRVHQAIGYTKETIPGYENDIVFLPHPLPSLETIQETRQTLQILHDLDPQLEVHVLISGGGSATFALPEDGIALEQYLEIIRLALASGFDIHELNLIRSLIDQVKGGKTARVLQSFTVHTWITSDVIGDDPRIIASGPTVPGISQNTSAISWLNRLFQSLELDVQLSDLQDYLPQYPFENHNEAVITTRNDFLQNLQTRIQQLGFQVVLADSNLDATITESSHQISQVIGQFAKFPRRVIVWSGEPTISLPTHAIENGQGGRISALCCLMTEHLQKYGNVTFIGLATDGKDGSSPSSGYVINGETLEELHQIGDIQSIIQTGNSGIALSSILHGISISPSDVNLLDVFLAVIQ